MINGTKINGDEIVFYDGFIRIFTDDKIVTKILVYDGGENSETISLNDCLKIIGYESGICFVIHDNYLSGTIYMYGNYIPASWIKYGETMGYA